jgi:hypothetical protein
MHKKSAPYLCISPWIRDPIFRYESRGHPTARLLGRPTELRQKILLLTGDPASLKGCTWGNLTDWTGIVGCISPLLRLDILHAQQIWYKEKAALESPQLTTKCIWGLEEREELNIARRFRRDRSTRGSQMNVRSRKRRRRDAKCWPSEQRYMSENPTSPLARKNYGLWKQLTRFVRTKHPAAQELFRGIFHGTKCTFEGRR